MSVLKVGEKFSITRNNISRVYVAVSEIGPNRCIGCCFWYTRCNSFTCDRDVPNCSASGGTTGYGVIYKRVDKYSK